jgi:hypothetical protein
VPVSVTLPVRICVCVKGVSPPCIRATVLVVKQEPITLPGDMALQRQHAALAGVSGQNWRFKISFRQPRTAGLPMAFSYGRWDQNRSPDDATPYASQHSQQTFVIHRVPNAVRAPHAAAQAHASPPL